MNASMQSRLKRIGRQIPLAVLIAVALFSIFTAYHFAYNINDSDFASELVLGNYLAGQNKLLSPDWFYGSELRVVSTNLVYVPLFKICSDWRAVYFLGACILQLLLVFSYYYLSRQTGMKKNAFFLSAALVLLPASICYSHLSLYQSFYVPCFIIGFLVVGLYLSVIRHRGQKKILSQSLRLFALFALAFAGSLNGARQIPVTMLPLFVTAVVTSFQGRPEETPFLPALKKRWPELCLALIVCLFAGLGFWFQNAVLLGRYSIYISPTDAAVGFPSIENLRNMMTGYLTLFGFQQQRTLFSTEGLLALASIFAAVVFLAVSLGKLLKRKADRTPGAEFTVSMFPVAMLMMTVVFFSTAKYQNYDSYYLPAFVWIFPFIGLYLSEAPASFRELDVKRALVYLACLVLFANGVYNNLYLLNPGDKQVSFSNLTQIQIDTVQRLQGVKDFIEENGFEVGYATHWQCNILTAITNGEIPMIRIIRVYPYPIFAYDDCLTYRQTRELSFVEDKEVFLLLTREEGDIFSGSDLAPFAIPVYEDDEYLIYSFDFSTETWEYLLEQARYLNQTSVLEQLLPAKGEE